MVLNARYFALTVLRGYAMGKYLSLFVSGLSPRKIGGTVVPPSDFQSDATKSRINTKFSAVFLRTGVRAPLYARAQNSTKFVL